MTGITKATDLLTRDEIRAFTRRSDLAGFAAVFTSWAIIAACFAVLARFWNPLAFVVAVIVLGGRQLGLAVLMHEAAHGTLFRTRALNEFVGNVFCARPIGADMARYRVHHLKHHAHTGTELDPDMSLVTPFPVSQKSLRRKILRDVIGIAGLKRVIGIFLINVGLLEFTVSGQTRRLPYRGFRAHFVLFVKNVMPEVIANLALVGVLALAGHARVYLAWLVAYMTTYSLFLRVRSMAEHACTTGGADPVHNTRTTRAGWLARLTVAPHAVNYHLEHHLLMTVPYFRLPALHRALAGREALPKASLAKGYREVLRLMCARP